MVEADVANAVFVLPALASAGPIQKRVLPLVQPIASSYSSDSSKPRNPNSLP